MSRKSCWWPLVVLAMAVGGASATSFASATEPTLDAILMAWKARQSRVKTLRAEWTAQIAQIGDNRPEVASPTPIPVDAKLSFKANRRFILKDFDRMRWEYTRKIWNQQGQIADESVIQVCDGKANRILYSKGMSDFPSLHISGSGTASPLRSIQLMVWRLVYRPLELAAGGLEPSRLTLDPRSVEIDGRKTFAIKQQCTPNDSTETTIWLDPERDYVPVRTRWTRDNHILGEIRVLTYQRDDTAGWVPQSWTSTSFSRGVPRLSETAAVKNCKFNDKIADVAFQLDPLPDSYVNNYVDNETYIHRADGSKQPILPGEFDGKNFEELLRTIPTPASR